MILSIIVILMLLAQPIFSQNIDTLESVQYLSSEPISELPKHIPIIQNKLYLFADYSRVKNKEIDIYIINNSKDVFMYEDNMLLYQEYETNNDTWKRSTIYNDFYNWCGFGSFPTYIRSGYYYMDSYSFPTSGIEHNVRFNIMNVEIRIDSLATVSNIGIGYLNKNQLEKIKYDDISLRESSCDFLISILENGLPNSIDSSEYHRIYSQTMGNLKKYYPENAQLYLKDSLAFKKFNSQMLFFSNYLAHEYLSPRNNKFSKNYSEEYLSAVDEMPEPLGGIEAIQLKIIIPQLAKKVGIKGRMYIYAYINKVGLVDKTEVIKGLGAGCDEVAIEAIESTNFKPGKLKGKVKKVKILIPISIDY